MSFVDVVEDTFSSIIEYQHIRPDNAEQDEACNNDPQREDARPGQHCCSKQI